MTLRVIIYVTFYPLGYDVWFFPFFLCEGLTFRESMTYPISVDKRQDSWAEVLFRVSLILFSLTGSIYLYYYPELIYWLLDWIFYIYKLGFDWGNNKLTNYHVNINI